jgi:hypothetical protein
VQLADMQRQLDEAKAAEAPAAPQAAPTPRTAASPASAGDGLTSQLSKLADLKAAGVLSDQEFASAKAKLLGI